MDILRSYRSVLVDNVPSSSRRLTDLSSVETYHTYIFETLESRYLLGLKLGVENDYVLARDLARLYQERAGFIVASSNSQDQGISQQRADEFLDKALNFLTLSEKLYTGDSNHPINDIYIARIRILMSQRGYNEALNLIRSLPRDMRDTDPSLETMYRLAQWATGGNPDAESVVSREKRARIHYLIFLSLRDKS